MPSSRLTDLSVQKLRHPDSGDVKHWDSVVPGFGIRVTKGAKSWFVVRGKERQLTTIGRYPSISLQEARKAAQRLLHAPASQNRSTSLLGAVEAFLADRTAHLRPSSLSMYARYLTKAPDLPLSKLTRDSVSLAHANEIKSWKVFGSWCVRNELLDRNPFHFITVSYGERDRVLSDDEIRTIFAYEYPPYSDIMKLCLLTGQRVGEVTKMKPSWIQGDTITIPDTVAKNGKAHTIVFNLLTAQYLNRYQHQTFNGFSKAKARFDRLHPMPHWVLHDLRRTFATKHAELGTPIHVVEKMLNHTSGSITGVAAIYNRHLYLKEMRAAALTYERHIGTIVGAEA